MCALWRADGGDSEREVSTRRNDVFNKFMRFWIVIVRRTDAPETNHQSSRHAVTPFGDKLSGAVQTPIKFERYGACTRVCREHTVAH